MLVALYAGCRTFVGACRIDLENDRRWEQAWNRLAAIARAVAAADPDRAQQLAASAERIAQSITGEYEKPRPWPTSRAVAAADPDRAA